jgi:NADH-quinone oxidoreductase subunit L
LYFYVFHGKARWGHADAHAHDHHHDHAEQGDDHAHHGLAPGQKPHESPFVVTLPLILLAIPSVIIGYFTITPLLFGTYFGDSIFVDIGKHPAMKELAEEFHGPIAMAMHSLTSPVLLLVVLGVLTAAIGYLWAPKLPGVVAQAFAPIKKLLDNKYYLDDLNQAVFSKGLLWIGGVLWHRGDQQAIDGFLVNGSAHAVGRFSTVIRHLQSGYLYHYAFAMIAGLAVLLAWVLYAYLPFVR